MLDEADALCFAHGGVALFCDFLHVDYLISRMSTPSYQPAPNSPLRNWVEVTVKTWGFAGATLFLFGLLEWLTERRYGASELTLTLLTLGGLGAPLIVLRGTINASDFLRRPGIRIISVVFQTGAALVAGSVAIGFLGG